MVFFGNFIIVTDQRPNFLSPFLIGLFGSWDLDFALGLGLELLKVTPA